MGPAFQDFEHYRTIFFYFLCFLKWQILGQTLEGHISLKKIQKIMNLFAVALFWNSLPNGTGFEIF